IIKNHEIDDVQAAHSNPLPLLDDTPPARIGFDHLPCNNVHRLAPYAKSASLLEVVFSIVKRPRSGYSAGTTPRAARALGPVPWPLHRFCPRPPQIVSPSLPIGRKRFPDRFPDQVHDLT